MAGPSAVRAKGKSYHRGTEMRFTTENTKDTEMRVGERGGVGDGEIR